MIQMAAGEFNYQDHDKLAELFLAWCKNSGVRGAECRWVLGRDLYQTYQTGTPNVLAKEMDEAIKWQIKDLLELPVDQALVTHYQPVDSSNQTDQLVAVATQKALIETLIDISHQAGVNLDSIDIEELVVGHALADYFSDEKIIGFIGEDSAGLVFNFYRSGGLSFTRHKKGRFMPNSQQQEFSLEQDKEAEQESFLLETQRTLDYVVSQIFRRPIDTLLLQKNSAADDQLAELIHQITELKVNLVTPSIVAKDAETLAPNLAEVGAVTKVGA